MDTIYSEERNHDESGVCSAQFLTEVSGLSDDELGELIDNEVIVPVEDNSPVRSFPLYCLAIASRARKLRDDFELDTHGMVLALTLLYRIDVLELELNAVRARAD